MIKTDLNEVAKLNPAVFITYVMICTYVDCILSYVYMSFLLLTDTRRGTPNKKKQLIVSHTFSSIKKLQWINSTGLVITVV